MNQLARPEKYYFNFLGFFINNYDNEKHHYHNIKQKGGKQTMDPMFQVYTKMGEIETKISNSVFENYKLNVAQTNDINNRAMQTAFHTDATLAAIKQAVNDSNTQNLLAFERLNSTVLQSAAHSNEVAMQEGAATRALIGGIDRENLNRQLSDRAVEIAALREGYRGWERDWGRLNGAYQAASVTSQINALGSQLQSVRQGVINTGTMTGTTQTSTPTNIA